MSWPVSCCARTRIRGFTSANARHESLYGLHACGWRVDGGKLHVEVSVPPNTSAEVVLPVQSVAGLLLNGQSTGAASVADGEVRMEVPPGQHTLVAPYA